MPTACAGITKNLLRDCLNPPTGGVETTTFLFNREDIATIVRDETNPNVIHGITLKAGKKGFRYEGYKKSLRPKVDKVDKPYSVAWLHTLALLVFGNGSDVKKEVEALTYGSIVAAVMNKDRTNDSFVELYGLGKGLVATTVTRDPLAENEGAWDINLASEAGDEEPHTPASFVVLSDDAIPVASYEDTIAALEALVAPVI